MIDEEDKILIPPDYTDADEGISEVDEGQEDLVLDVLHEINKEEEKKEKNMSTTPFSQQIPWGSSNNNSSPNIWSSSNNSSSGGFWGSNNNQQKTPPGWGWGSSFTQQQATPKTEIDRNKKVIFCDFLDVIVETYQSNGQPGLIPRDIYDLKPRFDVWAKIAAFNPERVYAIIPTNLMPSTNGSEGWMVALEYFCCCLSSFIRVPFINCQILAQSSVGQPKESIIRSVMDGKNPIPKENIVSIGVYSGDGGQSNVDIYAASVCGIDYVDLNRLLNNMY